MAPPKTLLFVGRLDSDTGFDLCLQLYQHLKHKMNLRLIVVGDGPFNSRIPDEVTHIGWTNKVRSQIDQADFVFASGYLTILETFLCRRLVLAAYSNLLRKDILEMHPQKSSMIIGQTWAEIANQLLYQSPTKTAKMIETGYQWAKNQTWNKLVGQYLELWQLK